MKESNLPVVAARTILTCFLSIPPFTLRYTHIALPSSVAHSSFSSFCALTRSPFPAVDFLLPFSVACPRLFNISRWSFVGPSVGFSHILFIWVKWLLTRHSSCSNILLCNYLNRRPRQMLTCTRLGVNNLGSIQLCSSFWSRTRNFIRGFVR